MRFTRLGVALLTDDVIASRDFYVGYLGFTPAVDLDWYVSLHHSDHPAYVVDLVAAEHPSIPEQFRRKAVAGVTIAVLVEDAAAAEARLRARGVTVAEPLADMPWGQRRFHLLAPEGTVVEVVQPIDPDPRWLAATTRPTSP